MQILGDFIQLLAVCSVFGFYKRFLEYFLGFVLMDCVSCLRFLSMNGSFGCGFVVFGCFRQVFNLFGLFFLFGLGWKVLQFSCHWRCLAQFLCEFRRVSSELRDGVCSKNDFAEESNKKISSCKYRVLKSLKNSNPPPPIVDTLEETIKSTSGSEDDGNSDGDGDVDYEQECGGEDDVFDVMTLRKLIKTERRRANAAYWELEKERMATSTAAEESMAMILRLQNEKSLVEMEAKQYRRLAEEKQLHDQEVIQSLRWIVMKHESERSALEDQFSLCRRRLKLCMNGGERDDKSGVVDDTLGFSLTKIEDAFDERLVSSLEMDLSPQHI